MKERKQILCEIISQMDCYSFVKTKSCCKILMSQVSSAQVQFQTLYSSIDIKIYIQTPLNSEQQHKSITFSPMKPIPLHSPGFS